MARSEGTHALLKRLEDAAKPLVAAIHGNALGGGLEVAQAVPLPRRHAGTRRSASPKCCSASFPAPAARSGCRASPARSWRSRCAPTASRCPRRRRWPPASSTTSSTGDSSLLPARSPSRRRKAAAHEIRKVRDIVISRRRRQGRARGVRRDARVAEENRQGHARALRRGRRHRSRAEAAVRRRARSASASCSPTASSRPNRRRCATCSSPSARSPRCPTSRRTRRPRTSSARRSSAPGTMGGGIAMNYANAGIPVLLKEVDQAALDRGLATIRKNYEVTMSKGKMTRRAGREDHGADHADDQLRRLRPGGHRHRGRVREHGPEEGDVRGARQGDAARLHPRVEHVDARHRPVRAARAAGRRRCSGTTSSARRT